MLFLTPNKFCIEKSYMTVTTLLKHFKLIETSGQLLKRYLSLEETSSALDESFQQETGITTGEDIK